MLTSDYKYVEFDRAAVNSPFDKNSSVLHVPLTNLKKLRSREALLVGTVSIVESASVIGGSKVFTKVWRLVKSGHRCHIWEPSDHFPHC